MVGDWVWLVVEGEGGSSSSSVWTGEWNGAVVLFSFYFRPFFFSSCFSIPFPCLSVVSCIFCGVTRDSIPGVALSRGTAVPIHDTQLL